MEAMLSHRVKNLFAITDSMIRMSSRSAGTKEELVSSLSGRLHALAAANALVRRSFGDGADEGVNLHELIERVLRPHDHAKFSIDGPDLSLGEQATNNLALVFHELATNAAKYGALSKDTGSVTVRWLADDTTVHLSWQESGGPLTTPPAALGFGSRLVATTIERIGGKIAPDWRPEGLSVQTELPLSALRY